MIELFSNLINSAFPARGINVAIENVQNGGVYYFKSYDDFIHFVDFSLQMILKGLKYLENIEYKQKIPPISKENIIIVEESIAPYTIEQISQDLFNVYSKLNDFSDVIQVSQIDSNSIRINVKDDDKLKSMFEAYYEKSSHVL